ncbi:unnamed protein product [Prorocentrum cordatum]|uniref:Limiting CO2-inducible protein B/C beta carbonyic anhydrase domain-containing protein n=1 Tax=Prorocentrum cordatum TaxID=2364126 RepID=A0ABN9W0Q0_9DINO|nr:unnamed protein product [Polarella glacialis]
MLSKPAAFLSSAPSAQVAPLAPQPPAAPAQAGAAPAEAWAARPVAAAAAAGAAGACLGLARGRPRSGRRGRAAAAAVGFWSKGVKADEAAASEGAAECFQCGRELEETAQDRVLHWLGRSPQFGSPCFNAMQKHFPNALPSKVVHNRSRTVLEEQYGFKPGTTLLGSSFCPDEINNQERDLASVMRKYYGQIFPMGGIGGAPYVGETGFAAFSSHVADNGDIIVVFGPHVGISMEGEVGKYLREGQSAKSTACGAVIGAYKACLCGAAGTSPEMDEADMQMSEIKQEFAPHAEKLSKSSEPMAACAYQAYEMVKDRMLRIVNTKFGSGRLVLIGGIQLNMPYPEFDDHFFPLMFEIRQEGKDTIDLMSSFTNVAIQQDLTRSPWASVGAQREVFAWLTWSPPAVSPVYQALHKFFPDALPGEAVHRRSTLILERYGFKSQNTLLGTSFCSDEINNQSDCLAVLLQDYWGDVFPMGGISGTPFTGRTGFAAFSSHVADEGNILVAFGPHVGISEDGEVGKIPRKGQANISSACGAVIGAYNACRCGWTEDSSDASGYDMQMDFCKRKIAPHADAIARTENPMAALAHQSYQMVKDSMMSSVNTKFGSGYLCLLGGIQINMPPGIPDHFYPVTFELRKEGEPTIDLIQEMRDFS